MKGWHYIQDDLNDWVAGSVLDILFLIGLLLTAYMNFYRLYGA